MKNQRTGRLFILKSERRSKFYATGELGKQHSDATGESRSLLFLHEGFHSGISGPSGVCLWKKMEVVLAYTKNACLQHWSPSVPKLLVAGTWISPLLRMESSGRLVHVPVFPPPCYPSPWRQAGEEDEPQTLKDGFLQFLVYLRSWSL